MLGEGDSVTAELPEKASPAGKLGDVGNRENVTGIGLYKTVTRRSPRKGVSVNLGCSSADRFALADKIHVEWV